MLDLRYVEENETRVRAMLHQRGVDDKPLNDILSYARARRENIRLTESMRAEKNRISEEVSRRKKEGKDFSDLVKRSADIDVSLRDQERLLADWEKQLKAALLYLPNIPHASVPVGPDDASNEVRRTWGEPRAFSFAPRPHWELGEILGIIDQERAVKVAGARFTMTVGAGARLERALQNFMLDEARKRGYTEVLVPFMVLGEAMTGTGQLPKFAAEMYKIEGEDLWLVPTAEVPVTNLHRDEILSAEELPKKYAAFTPCFRREAGAPGRDTRGMMRLHQFLKVELVKIVLPDNSYDELESLIRDAANILELLELPYREVVLSTGDLGFGAAKCVDLEVWLPSENKYREISSCSNYEAFQARRMNTRFRRTKGAKPEFVHTLNGSGLAIGRTVVAILENYQNEDGTVAVPPALQPYLGGRRIIDANTIA